MNEAALSSSPTKTLSSWWRAFKQKDVSDTSTGIGGGSPKQRPRLSRSSLSSTAIPQAGNNRASTPNITQVINQGRKVTIPEEYAESPIFGTPLDVSINYASVNISLTNENGRTFVYGHVPVIVAKCSVFLKQHGRDVEGIFRVSGSSRRIKVLQDLFNNPPRFGKDVDWQGFTVHDAANVLRRFLNNLPEPIIPLAFYDSFRLLLQNETEVANYMNAQAALLAPQVSSEPPDDMPPKPSPEVVKSLVVRYEDLIFKLPPASLQLLVYILDLLAVFAADSKTNRMGSFNLAAIFQPCILAHPGHHLSPNELQVSRLAVEFLVQNASDILQKVQQMALEDHDAESRHQDLRSRSHSDTTMVDVSEISDPGDTGVVTRDLLGPETPENTLAAPTLTLTVHPSPTRHPKPPFSVDADMSLEPRHRRHHSKSLSSATRPTPLERSVAAANANSEKGLLGYDLGERMSGYDRASSPVEESRTNWRHSLLFLKPGSDDGPDTSPKRARSPASWFSRRSSSSRSNQKDKVDSAEQA